jgi:hypothetical protein
MEIWRTISIGRPNLRSSGDFRKAFTENGISLSRLADSMLNRLKLTVAADETEVNLVRPSIAELGFVHNEQPSQIYPRAIEGFGLELCSPEVALQLRLQYQDQPDGEIVVVATEPIICAIGILKVFRMIRKENNLWLRSLCAKFPIGWQPSFRLVFIQPA